MIEPNQSHQEEKKLSYYQRNKEVRCEKNRLRYARMKERIIAQKTEYARKNPEKRRIWQKRYRLKNKEYLKKLNRLWYQKLNRKQCGFKSHVTLWRKHLAKIAKDRAIDAEVQIRKKVKADIRLAKLIRNPRFVSFFKARARDCIGSLLKKKGIIHPIGRQELSLSIMRIWYKQRGRCAYTGRKLDRGAHLDHIMPRDLGGREALENLQWLCPEANIAKSYLKQEDFFQLCLDVIQHSIPNTPSKYSFPTL